MRLLRRHLRHGAMPAVLRAGRLQIVSNPKVGEEQMLVPIRLHLDQDVAGLDVAVDDVPIVGVL
jgi:hypothetical protein